MKTHCRNGHLYLDTDWDLRGKRRCKVCRKINRYKLLAYIPANPEQEPPNGSALELSIYWDNRLKNYAAKNGKINTCREYGIEFKTVQAPTGAA